MGSTDRHVGPDRPRPHRHGRGSAGHALRQLGRRAGVRASDAALGATVAVVGGGMTWAAAAAQGLTVPPLALLTATAEGVALLWRRRAPVTVLAATVVLFVVGAVASGELVHSPMLAVVVAVYTVATARSRLVAAGAAAGAGLVAPGVVRVAFGHPFPLSVSVTAQPDHVADAFLGALLALGGAALLGVYVQTRRAYTAGLVERARRLEQEREERARRAVADERARVARELHDVAAHHLSGIVLQAGAAERAFDRDPDGVRVMVGDIRRDATRALGAMRRMVGLLRGDDDVAGRGPQPGLAELDGLVARADSEGIAVTVSRDEPPAVPREVDLAGYRIVQEALTNARRHAPGSRVDISVRHRDASLEVEVADDGAGARAAPPAGEGHGLVGMRERVTLLGGRFQAGPRPDAGWRVTATIPLDGPERP